MNEINDKNTENMAPCRDCKKFKAEISRLEETNSNLLETISNLRDQLKNPEPLVVPGPDLNSQFFDDSLEVNYIHKKDKFDNYIQKELKNNHWVHDLDSVFFVKQSKIDIDDIFIEAEDPDSEDLKSFLESERENLAPEPFVQDGIQFELHALPMEQMVVHGYYQPQTSRQSSGNHTNQLEFLVTLLPKHNCIFSDLFRYESAHSARRLNLALFSRPAFVDKNIVWVRGGVSNRACLFFNSLSTRQLAEKK